ncbi:phage head closure protein [[Clostridium] innocuum]|uniref:phage head closure protein n=1 Tax=Clostridium innocuum TaxID=1522 RepID=UPI0032D26EB9
MDIALLNVKITFQKNEVMVDKIGNHKNVWTDFYKCFATASGEGGSEKAVAGLIVDDTDISFTVRYCNKLSDIDSTKCRILFDGDVYNIVSIDHMNFKKKAFKFKCEKERQK